MSEETKPYLEYLDKEMTIMGVLSTFAVAVPALVLSQVAGATATSAVAKMWVAHSSLLTGGSASLLLSGLLFYRQRSLLAYYYGQICLALVPGFAAQSRDVWLKEADSWATWLHYRWALGFLLLGFVVYGIAFEASEGVLTAEATRRLLLGCVTLTLTAGIAQSVVLTRLRYSVQPWAVTRRYLRWRAKALLRPSKVKDA